jgi:type VI secretion system protein ImpH
MAATDRRKNLALSERLQARTCEFEFFQAVRLLEWMAYEARRKGEPAASPVGEDARPGDELVRFRVPASTAFPAAAVGSLAPRAKGDAPGSHPVELTISFLGLIGASGVLPPHYATETIARAHHQDRTLAEFFDIFQHRAAALFFRAWRKYRLPFVLERSLREASIAPADDPPPDDPFTVALRSLVGLGTAGLADRQQVADETIVFYSGHFTHVARSAVALERTLADYFGLRVSIDQFSGRWLNLPLDQRSHMPSSRLPTGKNCSLGRSVIVGSRIWDVASKFRIRLGPLTLRQFTEFLPGEKSMQQLTDLVRLYVGPALDFDVQPVLQRAEVPTAQLAVRGGQRTMLTRNAWLKKPARAEDAADAIFRT